MKTQLFSAAVDYDRQFDQLSIRRPGLRNC